MSENLKRAESLFNRIMNQNKPQGSSETLNKNYYKSSTSHNGQHSGNNNNHNHGNQSGLTNQSGHSNGHSNGNSHHRYSNRSQHKYSSNSQSHSLTQGNFDLPKRDPVKEAREAVEALEGDQHVLPYCWTMWFHSRSKAKGNPVPEENTARSSSNLPLESTKPAVAVDSYLQAATEISFPCFGNPAKSVKPIASLEQLWLSMSSVKKSHDLLNGSELLIFKTGVNPVWEDPVNSRGGRWVFRFSHRLNPGPNSVETHESVQNSRRRATLVWERLVLKTLTGSLLSGKKENHDALLNDVVGLVLSVRKDEEIISVWNASLHFGRKRNDEEEKKGTLTAFQARRVYCDAILRVIREVDAILQGSDCIETQLNSSSERVSGVTFEYRPHSDSSHQYGGNDRPRRSKNYHHHYKEDKAEEKRG